MYSAQQLSTLTPLYNIRHDSSHIRLPFCVFAVLLVVFTYVYQFVLITNMDF